MWRAGKKNEWDKEKNVNEGDQLKRKENEEDKRKIKEKRRKSGGKKQKREKNPAATKPNEWKTVDCNW